MSSFAELNNWNLESKEINNPDASVGVCCSHKVVAVGFNTLRYDASVGVLNPRINQVYKLASKFIS